MPRQLSPRQRQVLEFVRQFVAERGYPPTVRDVVRGCSLSSTSVADYNLRQLSNQGYFKRYPEISRGIELPGAARGGVVVPLVGYIAAGTPVPIPGSEAWHSPPLEMVAIPHELVGRHQDVYALRVKGQSMIDALIDDGDIVLMRPTPIAENGEMVAAWLRQEKEVTLKRFYREGDQVRLQPAHSGMAPLITPAENIEILGKVIAVLRRLG